MQSDHFCTARPGTVRGFARKQQKTAAGKDLHARPAQLAGLQRLGDGAQVTPAESKWKHTADGPGQGPGQPDPVQVVQPPSAGGHQPYPDGQPGAAPSQRLVGMVDTPVPSSVVHSPVGRSSQAGEQ